MRHKILYVTYHPEIGGGEVILLSLLSKLDRGHFDPIIVVPQKGQLSERLKELKTPTYCIRLKGYAIKTFFVPGMSPLGIYRFIKLAREIKPDVIHLNHLNLAVYAGLAGKLLKIPVVATAHGPWDTYSPIQDITSQMFTDKILANTSQVADCLLKRKIIHPKKVAVVHFGVDTTRFRPADQKLARIQFSLKHSDVVITIVGRFDPIKDHLSFLKAATIIQKNVPKARFLIVGSSLGDFSESENDKNQERLIKEFLAKHPRLAKKVIFAGFMNSMEEVYNATDILVSSSLSESFGLALAEAAASGVPTVATNVGGQHLIVKENQTGFLVPPQNPQALAQKILLLATSPAQRRKFGLQARSHIEKHFSLSHYVQKIEKTYMKMIQSKKSPV